MDAASLILAKAILGSSGGGGDGGVRDVKVDNNSVVSNGVASVPVGLGLAFTENDGLKANVAGDTSIQTGTSNSVLLTAGRQDKAVFFGLAKAAGADMASISSPTIGVYPEAQKSAISTMLNGYVAVSGSTPSITALSGIQYVCGEVSTLDITPPASGCFDVIFESGSTPTALTISNPTGTTVEWFNDFDPTNLSANTVYEINLLRMGTRYLGVAGSWS